MKIKSGPGWTMNIKYLMFSKVYPGSVIFKNPLTGQQ